MKASLNWLREYVDIDLSPEETADVLTMAGIEVESIIRTEKNLDGVVVGRILSIKMHPNADKLSLCQVNTGDDSYSIVCGASNMRVGDKIALALDGALLPNGINVRKTIIRGELSEGMMCSEQELEVGQDSQGIIILQDDLELGKDIVSALDLDDYTFELNVTPNRSDCLSMIGIAREIAAITGKALKMPTIEFREEEERVADLISVEVQDAELCPRYSARLIRGVAVGPSPFWMRRRLASVGIRPICNVVDATNYVLMTLGQPLHAFDFDLLSGRKIVVKRANHGDTFTSLDGLERTLFSDTLMIFEGEQPIAIGGIMGGLNSEVSEETSNVLIESAYFNPSNIRKTSKKLGLQTESSYRFERNVDPEGVTRALNQAAQLILDICGGEVAKGMIDQYPCPISQKNISLSIDRTNKILGASLEKEKVKRYLKSIELSVKDLDEGTVSVGVPPRRMDLSREIDLIEEVARLNGYDNIPITTPRVKITSTKRSSAQVLENKVKDILTSMGYYEVVNYSFISPGSITKMNLNPDHPFHNFVRIKNPLSEEQSIMRTTLIPGLLKTMKTNVYNKSLDLKLFEIGTVFHLRKEEKLPQEKKMLSALVTGLRYGESWSFSQEEVDFYDMKGSLENLFTGLEIMEVNLLSTGDIPYLHPGKTVILEIGDTKIGAFGEVRPDVLEGYNLSKAAYIFEIDFDLLVKHTFGNKKIKPISKYPPVYRDIALILDDDFECKKVHDAILDLNDKLIEDVQVFDVFRGEPIAQGKKSLAYRIKYQSYERTLTDEEVNRAHRKVVSDLEDRVGARIRD